MCKRAIMAAALLCVLCGNVRADDIRTGPLLEKLRAVGPGGQGHQAAAVAWQQLVKAELGQLDEVLAALDGANPLAANWIRSAAETIVDRGLAAGGSMPDKQLEAFLANKNHAPRARRLAYELILSGDESARQRLIPGMLDDPSLELRRDAVSMVLDRAAGLAEKSDKAAAIGAYEQAMTAARDLDQIDQAAKGLEKLGQTVDLARHFGFVMDWHVIGPFENADNQGFDVAYGPEINVDLRASYPGKTGDVAWQQHASSHRHGVVDLNKVLGKQKGSIAYAYGRFRSESERDVELRIGSITGVKVWLNGKLVTSGYAYHDNMQIDQYSGKARLRKGDNHILVKVAQNEQEEDWAQRWEFQLRVCDQYGTAVLPQTERP